MRTVVHGPGTEACTGYWVLSTQYEEEGGEEVDGAWPRYGAAQHHRRGRLPAQPEERRRRDPAREDDRLLRAERLGQVVAGAGHDLCGGAKTLHRVAVVVCAAVPRSA